MVYLAIALDEGEVESFGLHETIYDAEEWAETLKEMSSFRLVIFEIGDDGEAWKLVDRTQ